MAEGSLPLGLLAIAETLRITAGTLEDAALGRLTREACDRRLTDWSGRLVRAADIHFAVQGRERVELGGEAFVVMSNHQSNFDIPVLYHVFPASMRMVAKTELFRIPAFGRAMRAAEFIEVDRRDKARARHSIELAKERLRSGVNVWIAPEGTRSEDGQLGPFKKGGFILALDTGARILPISIDGTRFVLPKHSARVSKGKHVRVQLHAPIDPAEYGPARRDELVARVREVIGSGLTR
ncbi:MAG: 1-acyl-sn-glycerol-3-phosphate acyltransferase [Deltaproteobacteria bacterium]|nr:1-acyl-sn-glycerol-3-phosphate acyltransferase [Deltaproteobacteria bacterium]